METMKLNNKQRISDGFTWLILMSFMTFSITYMITYALKFEYAPVKLMIITLIIISILSVVLMNKFTIGAAGICGIVLLTSRGIYLYKKHMLKDTFALLMEKITLFCKWSVSCIQGYPIEDNTYTQCFIILLCLITAITVYYFTVKKFHFFVLFAIGSFLCVFEITQKRMINPISLYLFIFTNLIYFFKSRYLVLKKELDNNDYYTYAAFMKVSIYIGIGILAVGTVLANRYPYKVQLIHNIVDSLNKKPYYYVVDNFSVKSAGLQIDDNLLGGDITPNDAVVLKVETPSPTYLKAISKAIYTGKAWQNEDDAVLIDLNNEKLQDTAETTEVVKWLGEDKDSLNTLFYKNTATIKFVNMRTKSLFIPAKMETFDIKSSKRDVFVSHTDTLSLEKEANKNFTYTAEFYEPKYTNDKFKDVMRNSKIGFYNEIKEKYPNDTESINKWAEHAAFITEKYTQLPEELPKRIGELARSVTQEKTNNYDKVKAIEEYLIANYHYTLKPGNPREDEDFVDQFLFEKEKGYCTYFASAMAVLTRSIGIPCRYAEGYILPNKKEYNESAYRVTNKRAHAWAEVYFEGMGWIVFEATPPYRQIETKAVSGFSMEDAMRNAKSSYTVSNEIISHSADKKLNIYSIIIVLGLSMIGSMLIWLKLHKRKMINRMPRDASLYLYKSYLDLLNLRGLSVRVGETETTFAKRVEDKLLLGEISFIEITHIFLKARYSQLEITEDEKQKMITYRRVLLEASKKTIGPIRYLIYKIKYI